MKIKIISIAAIFFVIDSYSQSLEDYLTIAAKNSPELKASKYLHESAQEKIVQVGSLPNTTIGLGYFVQEAETRVGPQKAKISIGQKVPWFGTLTAHEEGASYKAKAQLNNIELVKRKLFFDVKSSYYQLFELQSKEHILLENIKTLETFETLALKELENNRSTMVDILKIRIEKNELQNKISMLQETMKSKIIVFNLLLNRKEQSYVNIIDSISIEEEFMLNRALIMNNPKLLKLDNLKKSLEKSELAAKKEGLPMVGFGIDYVLVDERSDLNITDNGKDVIMPMVSLSIPLFSKKYRSKQKQLSLEQKAIVSTKQEVENELQTIFKNSETKLKNAKSSIHTQKLNLAEVENAKNILLAAYQSSKIDFEQLLEVQLLQLRFQLNKVVSEKQYAIHKSMIEFLTTTL